MQRGVAAWKGLQLGIKSLVAVIALISAIARGRFSSGVKQREGVSNGYGGLTSLVEMVGGRGRLKQLGEVWRLGRVLNGSRHRNVERRLTVSRDRSRMANERVVPLETWGKHLRSRSSNSHPNLEHKSYMKHFDQCKIYQRTFDTGFAKSQKK